MSKHPWGNRCAQRATARVVVKRQRTIRLDIIKSLTRSAQRAAERAFGEMVRSHCDGMGAIFLSEDGSTKTVPKRDYFAWATVEPFPLAAWLSPKSAANAIGNAQATTHRVPVTVFGHGRFPGARLAFFIDKGQESRAEAMAESIFAPYERLLGDAIYDAVRRALRTRPDLCTRGNASALT